MNHFNDTKPTIIDKRSGEVVRHMGASHRQAFWAGYDGSNPVWINPRGRSMCDSSWRDGRDWRKIDERNNAVIH